MYRRGKKTFIKGAIYLLIFWCFNISAQTLIPEDLNDYLREHYKYKYDKGDYWQTPEETLKLKKGDCEDFAFLTKEILTYSGYKADVYLLSSEKGGHAVCVFYDERVKRYSLFTNGTMLSILGKTPINVLEKTYKPIRVIHIIIDNPIYGESIIDNLMSNTELIKYYEEPSIIGKFKL